MHFCFYVQHNKVYDTEGFYHRLHIFTENKRRIDHHNAGNHSFTSTVQFCTNSCLIMCRLLPQRLHGQPSLKKGMHVLTSLSFSTLVGLNQFSDMTFEEFRKLFLLTEPQVWSVLQYKHTLCICYMLLYMCFFDDNLFILVSCRTAPPPKGVMSAGLVRTPSL